jgi:pectate lyase
MSLKSPRRSAAARVSRANVLGMSLFACVLGAATAACERSSVQDEQSTEETASPSGNDRADAASSRGDNDSDGEDTARADAGAKPAGGKGEPADDGNAPSSSDAGGGGQSNVDAGARPGDAGEPSDAGSVQGPPDASGSGDTTIAMTIPTASNGNGEIRPSTTVLKSGKNGGKDVWDFENKRIGVNNTVECEGSEGQLTVFEVEDGVTVKNLIIAGGIAGGNGIVCKGSCTLDHVYWEDVCEDAATNSKDGATMVLDHVIALHASDKMFQHNAKGGSRTIVKNSYVADFGKLWRSCGDCQANGGPRHLELSNVRVDGIKSCVAGANQNYGDTVTVRDLYVKGGYDAAKDKPKICQVFIGVTDHKGESTKVADGASQWNTATCKLGGSDVKSY